MRVCFVDGINSNTNQKLPLGVYLLYSLICKMKAYDTTWKYGILQDLHSMGLRENMLIFIGNFLSESTFHLGTILIKCFTTKVFHRVLSRQPL